MDFDLVKGVFGVRNTHPAVHGTEAVIVRAEHDALDPGQLDRAEAHDTRLDSTVQRRAQETPRVYALHRRPQRGHFGVFSTVPHLFNTVSPRAEQLIVR